MHVVSNSSIIAEKVASGGVLGFPLNVRRICLRIDISVKIEDTVSLHCYLLVTKLKVNKM